MTEWKKVKIGDLLKRYKEPVEIQNDVVYRRVTIRTKYKGVKIRDEKKGSVIGTKNQWKVKKGQFILSRIDARFGAMGIIPDEVDGAIVTNDFLAFDINKKIIDEYLFYQLLNSPIFIDACRKASRGLTQRKRVNEAFFLNYEIRIPSPSEQGKIVSKIKKSENEQIKLNQKIKAQKNYIQKFRQAILQDAMNDADKIVLLDEICDFVKGDSPIQKTDPGKYPLVVTGEDRKTSAKFQFDAKAVCIPLVSSTGHGKKSLNYVHYQEGKFALGNILVALVPKNENILNAKFLHQYLLTNKDSILVGLMKGMANVTLPIRDLKKVEIALPSIRKQNKAEALMQKLDKLEVKNSQNQKTADRLMQAVLKEAFN